MLGDGEWEAEGLAEAEGDAEAVGLPELEGEGEPEALGEALPEGDGDGEGEGATGWYKNVMMFFVLSLLRVMVLLASPDMV